MNKPQNLVDAESNLRLARLTYQIAKGRNGLRDARETVDFWSDKVAMLTVMFDKGMLKNTTA
jgi:hypothetical protein